MGFFRLYGEGQDQRRTGTGVPVQPPRQAQLSAMGLCNRLADRQAQTEPPPIAHVIASMKTRRQQTGQCI